MYTIQRIHEEFSNFFKRYSLYHHLLLEDTLVERYSNLAEIEFLQCKQEPEYLCNLVTM